MAAPKLRFKEFDGDWTKSSLINLAKDKSLNNGVFNDQNKVGQGYKLINVLDMYIERDIDESRLSLLDLDLKEFERNKVKFGDIFFTRSSLVKEGIAFSNVYLGHSQDITYDGHLIKLSPDLEVTNPSFLNYALKTSKVRKQLIQGGKTAAMTTIGQQEVGKTPIDFPVLDEQTKIASFLSAVDEKISQLTQKHELLSQYKQGMMQKLFSQQVRFKADDGSEFGEWETTTLGQTGKFIGGGTPSKENSEFWEGSIPWISSSDLTEESIFKINITRFISQNALNQSATKLVPANSILIVSRVGVGKVAITPNEICTSQDFTSLTLHKGSSIFFAYLIKSLTPYLLEMNQGTSIKGFIKDDLANLELKIPCIEEQTKIANFLSAIDQKIEVVAQQIEQAKQWKKGLLQQMFV